MRKVFLICLIASLSSCNLFLRISFGIKKPVPETPESVMAYAVKKGMHTDNILFPKDSITFMYCLNRGLGTPEMLVFNREGKMVIFKDSATCNAPGFEYTEHICEGNILGLDSTHTLKDELSQFVRIGPDGNPSEVIGNPGSDYTVLIYWMKCIGRLNKDHTMVWDKNLRALKDCNVDCYQVNLDFPAKYFSKKDMR